MTFLGGRGLQDCACDKFGMGIETKKATTLLAVKQVCKTKIRYASLKPFLDLVSYRRLESSWCVHRWRGVGGRDGGLSATAKDLLKLPHSWRFTTNQLA